MRLPLSQPHQSKSFVWTLFILFCLFWLYALGLRTLVPTDEGRYAEMAREMAASGDWITTRLNGIKYFEKPPLQVWMNALTFTLFGLGELQARLWTGLCGLGGIVLVAFTGQRVFNARVGFFAGLVLGSSFLWVALGHMNTLDMGLSGMMTLTLCGLLLGQRNDASASERRNWMLACWAGMALAVLSKGLIGLILPGAVLLLYMLFSRDWAIRTRLHPGLGLLLFFAITTPWFVLVSLKNPEFARFFFIHEHFARFTSTVHHRTGPLYYFVPVLLLGILPWLGMLLQSLWHGRRESAGASGPFQAQKMLLVWAVFIFVFFSISSSKLQSYILPIFPALALLIACYLEKASARTVAAGAAFVAVVSGIGLGFTGKIPNMAKVAFELPLYQAYMYWIIAAALVLALGSTLAAWVALRHKDWAIVILAVCGFIAVQIAMTGHDPIGRHAAGINHIAAIEAELTPDTPLYAVGRYEQVIPFYLRRTMTMVQHADELEFGLSQEPHLWLPTLAAFVAQWKADREQGVKSVALMSVGSYAALKAEDFPMRVIAEDPRRVIVVSTPLPRKAAQ